MALLRKHVVHCVRVAILGASLLLLVWQSPAQAVNPGVDKIFRPDEVAGVFLTMAPADKAFLQDPANALSETYFPATFRMKNSQMDTTLTLVVGVRLRGNTSRYAEKKSFKIDFREFGGKKFFEYKKFNLKANVNDPSLVREALTLQQYRELGVHAARTHHVKLYINDEYMGVYLNVEQVDDVFLSMRLGHSSGFMYKCNWGANLSSPGQALDAVLFESEINKSSDTRTEISQFIQYLNGTAGMDFQAMIESRFEVDKYLRQLAVEALMGHWDGYSYNQNNFYMYYNGQTSKVEFIPYDVDNTWGIDWVGQDWASFDLNAWYMPGQPRPLTTRILSVPAYFEVYKGYLKQLIETTFNHAFVDPQLASMQSMLNLSVYEDTYYARAFGFTYSSFTNSFTTHMNNHVRYGLTEYIDERTKFAEEQMPGIVTSADDPSSVSLVYPNPSSSPGFYLTSAGNPPLFYVFHSTGSSVPVLIQAVDETTYRVTLPESSARGVYLIKHGAANYKWIYQ